MAVELSKCTFIFGLRLWVVIGILVGSFIVLTLFLLSLPHLSPQPPNNKLQHPKRATATPVVSKEIQEIVHVLSPPLQPEIHVDIGKAEHRVMVYSDRESNEESKGTGRSGDTETKARWWLVEAGWVAAERFSRSL